MRRCVAVSLLGPAIGAVVVIGAVIYFPVRRLLAPSHGPPPAPVGAVAPAQTEPHSHGEPRPVPEDLSSAEAYGPIARFVEATDPHAMQELAALMRDDPRGWRSPLVVQAMLSAAQGDPSPDRRQAALFFLCGALDTDRRVAAFLDGRLDDEAVLAELPLFLRRNPTRAEAFHDAFLRRFEENGDAATLRGIEPTLLSRAHLDEVEQVALQHESPEARATAYEIFGRLAADERARFLPLLASGYREEPESAVRSAALMAILRLGGRDAIPVLEALPPDAEIDAYLDILRERPEIPFDELLRERRNREP